MPSMYKIYTAALGKNLRQEVEEKVLLSGSQADLEKGWEQSIKYMR